MRQTIYTLVIGGNTMCKKSLLVLILLFAGIQINAASIGLIVVLSSLSTTGMLAVNTITDSILMSSNKTNRMRQYIEENETLLTVDIARSYGDSLEGAADIVEIPEEKRELFYKNLKDHFSIIFPEFETSAEYKAETIVEIADMLK
jgi:hypothetical protein